MGILSMPDVGLKVSRYLGRRFGSDREGAEAVCALEARRLLAVRTQRGWSAGERMAWKRWAPLILILPGVDRWSTANRRALVEVVRAKGGRRESEFVLRFDRHRPLREAIRKLARDDG